MIQRHTKVANAGGFSWVTANVTAANITVRIYNISSHNQREITMPDGEIKQVTVGMLAPDGTDVISGHNSYDTFVWQGRTYRVVGVRSYKDVNIPACVQCDCVAV